MGRAHSAGKRSQRGLALTLALLLLCSLAPSGPALAAEGPDCAGAEGSELSPAEAAAPALVTEEEPIPEEEPAAEEEPVLQEEPPAEEEPDLEEEPVLEEEPPAEEEPIPEELPAAEGSPAAPPVRSVSAAAEDGSTITVSGDLPEGAYVRAEPVSAPEDYVGADKIVLFAYDIKILLPAADGEEPAEYQPEIPVTVTVAPPEDAPIEAPVTVVHVDAENNAQPVAATTENGAVAFEAESFSIYIITLSSAYDVSFNVAASSYVVRYGTTDATLANITTTLATATVNTPGPLYFTVTGNPTSVTRGGATITPDTNDVYTINNITGDTDIYIGNAIAFDLAKGPVIITSTSYSGYSSGWTTGDPDLFGAHAPDNQYTVTQSGSGATTNTIRFSEAGTYDMTLDGVNIAGSGTNKATNTTGSILIDAGEAAMYVTLRLRNTNTIERLHYCSTGSGSLTITSAAGDGETSGTLNATGRLNATGTAWEAVIGGTDDRDSASNIIIRGGTIHATGQSSAAIGGGGNGNASVYIYGGAVDAENNGTGATIGGGGADTGNGGSGTVTIFGGTVTAINRGNGVAIGGGSTNASASTSASGAAGTVTISGGHVTATAGSGGTAIGGGSGGNDKGGTAGAADVTISGGTVVATGARGISGGWNKNTSAYATTAVDLSGGSYTGAVAERDSYTSSGFTYKLTKITLLDGSTPVTGAAVSTVNGSLMGTNVVTDNDGSIYLWLAADTSSISIVANGTERYSGSVTPGTGGTLTPGAAITDIVFYLEHGNVTIGTDTYSGYDAAGNPFTGARAEGQTYTVTQTDSGTPNSHTISFTGNGLTAAVTLRGIYTTAANSISIPAANNAIKHVTLLLAGTNRVKSVFYYTGGDGATSANASTLTIDSAESRGSTSGELIVNGPAQWQAAIGGDDTNSAVTGLTIAGGTITATGLDSAAIGGGGNGYTVIEITGGSITATNTGTGAAIGGGGGRSDQGGYGSVTISGGTVNATNNGSGVAIGGGGSSISSGSEGSVTISGGYVTAMTPSGNAIGGGNTNNSGTGTASTGGGATVTISGGTVNTGHIGGGYSVNNGYASSNFTVIGGSINCTTSANPTNGSAPVYMTRVTLYENNAPKRDAAVSSLGVQGLVGYTYGMNGVSTDSDGVLYIGLPLNTAAHTAMADGKAFTGNVATGGTGVLSYGELAFHTIRVSPSSHYSLWLDAACTSSPFSGVINVTDVAEEPESFTFYLKCVADSEAPDAYVPGAGNAMVRSDVQPVLVDSSTAEHVYSYTFSNIDGDRVVGFITEVNGTKQLALDLSMGDVILREDTTGHRVSCGPFSFGNFTGHFYLTTSGINSGNNLTVNSGSPTIYLDRLNLTPSGSGVYIAGGEATVTYSSYNNQISSSGAAAISVSAGATLNLSTEAPSNSLTLTSVAASSIGGAGTVNLALTSGHLSLNPHSGSSQITAANYQYTVASQTEGTPPYSFAPPVGELAGYSDGTNFYASAPAVSTKTTLTACTIFYVDVTEESRAAAAGNLVITLSGTPPASVAVTKDGAALTHTYDASTGTLTISGADAKGHIVVTAGSRTVQSIVVTGPTQLEYRHGDSLSLSGLTATLTYTDSTSSSAIPYADFADYGITVSPQGGQVLYTETHHGRGVSVSCGGITAVTAPLTVNPAVTILGNPTAGYDIAASTAGQSGSSYCWEYDDGTDWQPFDPAEEGASLSVPKTAIGKRVQVTVVFNGIYSGSVTSDPVTITAPQLSVTVPQYTVVTVAADGTCTVPNGVITNNSALDVYVTKVSFEWTSDDAATPTYAGGLFYDHKLVIPKLTLGATAHSFTITGSATQPEAYWPAGTIGKVSKSGGTLALTWEFDIGKSSGNYLTRAPAQAVQVATITYTVGFEPPS